MPSILNAVLEVVYLSAAVWLPIYFMGTVQRWIHIGLGRRLLMVPAVIGVPVHELSHYFAVKLFALCGAKYKVVSMKLFQPMKDGTLGYVEYAYAKAWYTPFTNLIIGMAPLIGGIAMFCLVTHLLNPDFYAVMLQESSRVSSFADAVRASGQLSEFLWRMPWGTKQVAWAATSLSLLAFMLPSRADFQGASVGVVIVLLLMVASVIFLPRASHYIGQYSSIVLLVLPVVILANIVMLCLSLISYAARSAKLNK